MKRILTLVLLFTCATSAWAQRTDTVVVELAKTSRMVFTIKDKSDLEQLKQYDFQALFNDIIQKLERNDSVVVIVNAKKDTVVITDVVIEETERWANDSNIEYREYTGDKNENRKRYRHTSQSFNLDLGINSYLEDGKFPDEAGAPYAVRPWGSWYVGLNSTQRTRFTKNFFAEWAIGVSWYNFKFQNDNTIIVKKPEGLDFIEDTRDVKFIKSKLTVPYLNVSLVPMLDFGSGDFHHGRRLWRSYNSAFRIGVGPYAGYRIGGNTKLVYKEDGEKERDRNRDNYYLSNLRYGLRLQVGVRSADFFINYDMNELFAADKGPALNALSFGVSF